ncbi:MULTISPECIES: MFS transporter [Streptomyces]|uniref:MFS transporter n=1 Tax=Streptomyces TaxID=1883 RepID=UPI00287FD432|nr:MFS transporter [Streptomyces sp. CGMCC 4.1456]WNF67904.1 MFS transporter [Streptomyces sp. CGMCC 4.1456]
MRTQTRKASPKAGAEAGAATATGPPRATGRDWAGLTVVLLAMFMSQIDMFIVNVAAPGIQADLNAGFGQLQFVIDGYVIAYAAGMVTGGRLGDRIGRKRTFQYGVATFTLTSLLCALAPSPGTLIAARVLQGLSAAVMTPQVLSLIRAVFVHERDRARAVGAYGASIGAGVIAGLVGGGLLLDLDVAGLGWRMIFLINVPIGAAILCAAVPAVTESRSADLPRLDIIGAVFTAVLLPLVLIPLILGGEHGWPWWTYGCFALGAAGAVAFLRWERRTEDRGNDPLLPSRLLRAKGFPLSMGTVLLFFSGNAGLFLVLTYHLQSGLRLTPLAASMVFVPLGLGFIVASAACRRLAARFGIGVSVAGGLVMAVSLAAVPAVTGLDGTSQAVGLAAVMGVSGFGQGLVVAPLVDTVLSRVHPDDAGAGSGVLNTVTQAGMAFGVAVIGALYRGFLGTNPQAPGPDTGMADFAEAFDLTAYVLAALAVGTALLAVRLGRVPAGARPAAGAHAEGVQGPADRSAVRPDTATGADTDR